MRLLGQIENKLDSLPSGGSFKNKVYTQLFELNWEPKGLLARQEHTLKIL